MLTGNRVQGCGLATAIWTKQTHDLTGMRLETNINHSIDIFAGPKSACKESRLIPRNILVHLCNLAAVENVRFAKRRQSNSRIRRSRRLPKASARRSGGEQSMLHVKRQNRIPYRMNGEKDQMSTEIDATLIQCVRFVQ